MFWYLVIGGGGFVVGLVVGVALGIKIACDALSKGYSAP